MQAVVFAAVNGHAGSHDLGKAVDIMGINTHIFFHFLTHGLGPGLTAENAHAQGQLLEVDAVLKADFIKMESVGRRAGQNRGAEIADEDGLTAG